MINDVRKDAETRMKKSIEALRQEFSKVRTGRAHTSLLDHIRVPAYGNEMPLNQVANVNVGDSRTLTITPWDKSLVQAIEKAIMSSDLGLNPTTTGTVMRIVMPPLTEERRRDLVKVVRGEAEAARVAIRNIRRDGMSSLKELVKEKEIGEDEERRAQEDMQKLTDKYIAEVEKVLQEKEADLMEV